MSFTTPPGRAWEQARIALVADLGALVSDTRPARTRFVIEAVIVASVARFQLACRDLFLMAATELARRTAGPVAPTIRQGLVAESRLARGNATSAALASDFARVGVDVWDLTFPDGAEGMTVRFELDEINALRNDLAHGRRPAVDDGDLIVEDALDALSVLDGLVRIIELGVVVQLDRVSRRLAANGEAE